STDIILGLGYDDSLGNKIGITLIATGFEYKDPFDKKVTAKPVKKEDKIVMELQQEDPKKYHQPVFVFDEQKEEMKTADDVRDQETIIEQKGFKTMREEDIYASAAMPVDKEIQPTIVEIPQPAVVDVRDKNTVDKFSENVVHFTLSSEPNPTAAKANPAPPKKANTTVVKPSESNKDASAATSSGGYLAKPLNIYAEARPNAESNSSEEPLAPLQDNSRGDEPVSDMQLVVKNSHEATEGKDEPKVRQTMPIMMPPAEELPPADEAGELKRRAMERIAKLRNLSFNVNAADPNNEFESVPAYLRRNMELHNSLANVESFYSNYTVKSDENNKAEISTINTFLDGKKPD
ncbi:MAG TPA: hypothetical protein VG847_15255, partial [Chitinophagaceae bacterium]|nr:hypothetical protein [Chitinophagaceae bacterium]